MDIGHLKIVFLNPIYVKTGTTKQYFILLLDKTSDFDSILKCMPLKPVYDAKEYEDDIYTIWKNLGIGSPEAQTKFQDLDENSSTHSILMPPPNLTGNMHAGHSFQHFLMDSLSRINRQKGNQNLWFPGVDHAGIQLEGVIDKLIKKGDFDEEIKKFGVEK